MKRVFSLILATLMLLSFAACTSSPSSEGTEPPVENTAAPDVSTPENQEPQGEQPSGEDVLIGGMAPLTGPVAQYGVAANNGALLAIEKINAEGGILGGRQINYICEDDKHDATEAINAYNKLVQSDGVTAIFGNVTTSPALATVQLAAIEGIPMITPSATNADVTLAGENIFRACFTDPYQGELMAHYAYERLGAKTAAVLYDTGDAYSQGIAESFRDTAAKIGLTLVGGEMEGYASGTADFSAQLTKIKSLNPDVVLVPVYYEDVAMILTQARELGLDVPFLGGDGWDGTLNQIDPSNVSALNNSFYCSMYSAESDNPDLQEFLANYSSTYGESANMFAVLGYDAMMILINAIDTAGTTDYAPVVDALKNTNYAGLLGTTKFDGNRNPIREPFIIEFVDGAESVVGAYDFR